MSAPKLADALATSHVVHERATLEAAILRMAGDIRGAYADGEVPVYLTVLNRGQTSGSGLAWLHRPATPLRGRKVLLADDILDEGHTLLAIKHWCEDQGAVEVRVAVLAEKVHDRCVGGICADHVGVQVPDAYVFGYGMDFHDQGRNLPAIYALGE